MKSKILWALLGLNVVLLALLVSGVTRPKQAMAQRATRPADYLMIPGEVSGGVAGVVYIVDTTNGLLSAMSYEDSQRTLQSMPTIDLNRVFAQGAADNGDDAMGDEEDEDDDEDGGRVPARRTPPARR